MAAAEHGDRHRSDRERPARRRLARLRRHGRPAPRLLRSGKGSALQARSGKAGSRCLSCAEFKPDDDDLWGLYHLAARLGSHHTDTLDAKPAGLGQGADRRCYPMAMVRVRFRVSRWLAVCLWRLSPGAPHGSTKRRWRGTMLAFPVDPARDHSSGRGPRTVDVQDSTHQRQPAGGHRLRPDDYIVCRVPHGCP